ncbi:MAG: hypothetical protein GY801_10160, partial [bacterium]|nr:hypothetical protein [bacterium]
MIVEWKYYFKQSTASEDVLNFLLEERKRGNFFGSTFPKGGTHTCFNIAQCEQIEEILRTSWPGINFQKKLVFRGDLFDVDFGLKTFRLPLVQWCPSPIFSFEYGESILPEEPWGLSMEGSVLFKKTLRRTIDKHVIGLTRKQNDIQENFDCYQIDELGIPIEYQVMKEAPLSMNCSGIDKVDIFKPENDIILCSSRFANLLKRDWNGMIHNKF